MRHLESLSAKIQVGGCLVEVITAQPRQRSNVSLIVDILEL